MLFLIQIINIIAQVLSLLVLAHVILSYFMSPFHPIRQTIDSIVNPMLDPIRRVIPNIGMLDFSPIVLLILIQVLANVVTSLLRSLL
jgi:YggT family protein